MRVGAGVKGTGSGSTGASPGSAQVSAGGASKASSGAAESSESSESSASSGSESESESSESESDKARDEKKVAGRGKARVMDGGKAGGKVAASKAGKTSGSSVGGRRASAGGKSDGSKSSESESSESESSAGESDGKRAAAAVPTGGKKRRRRRRRRGKKGSISFAGATEPVGGFAAQRGVTNVDAPPAVLAGGEGARVARAGVGAGASVRGSAAQAGGKEKGGMPRRFRFDDEGNKVDIEEEAASSDAALNIGACSPAHARTRARRRVLGSTERARCTGLIWDAAGAWSAPASHKKSCFEKQQKMQRQVQAVSGCRAPWRASLATSTRLPSPRPPRKSDRFWHASIAGAVSARSLCPGAGAGRGRRRQPCCGRPRGRRLRGGGAAGARAGGGGERRDAAGGGRGALPARRAAGLGPCTLRRAARARRGPEPRGRECCTPRQLRAAERARAAAHTRPRHRCAAAPANAAPSGSTSLWPSAQH